jgi:hypothetical protein
MLVPQLSPLPDCRVQASGLITSSAKILIARSAFRVNEKRRRKPFRVALAPEGEQRRPAEAGLLC